MRPEEKHRIQSKIEAAITQLHQDLPQLEAQARPVAPDEAIGRLLALPGEDRCVACAQGS